MLSLNFPLFAGPSRAPRRALLRFLAGAALTTLSACASTTDRGIETVDRKQLMLIDAATVNERALDDYLTQNDQAKVAGTLVTDGPGFDRTMRIVQRLVNETGAYRADAPRWDWQLVLIARPDISLTCAPGGRLSVFDGMFDRFSLNDAELAAILAHEMAHCLREHYRENLSQKIAAGVVAVAALTLRTDSLHGRVSLKGNVFSTANSPEQEQEANALGADLLARAGYDPQMALRFWYKTELLADDSQVQDFYRLHARLSGAEHRKQLAATMPQVMPLYLSARRH